MMLYFSFEVITLKLLYNVSMKLVPATDGEPILIDTIIPRTVQTVRIESSRDNRPHENTAAWYSSGENLIAVPTLEEVRRTLEMEKEITLALLAEEELPILLLTSHAYEILCSDEGCAAYLDFLETHENVHADQDARFNTGELTALSTQILQDFLELDSSKVASNESFQEYRALIASVVQLRQSTQAHKETQAFFEAYSHINRRYGEEITFAVFCIRAYPKFTRVMGNFRDIFSDINMGIYPYKTAANGKNIYGGGFQDFTELAILTEKPDILQHIKYVCATPEDFANFLLDSETELLYPDSAAHVGYLVDKKRVAGRWFARDTDKLIMESAKLLGTAIGDVQECVRPNTKQFDDTL